MYSIIPKSAQLMAFNTLSSNASSAPFETTKLAQTQAARLRSPIVRTIKSPTGQVQQFRFSPGAQNNIVVSTMGGRALATVPENSALVTVLEAGEAGAAISFGALVAVCTAIASTILVLFTQQSVNAEEPDVKKMEAEKAARLKKQKDQQGAKPKFSPPKPAPLGAPPNVKKTGIVPPIREPATLKPVLPYTPHKISPSLGTIASPFIDWKKLNPSLNPDKKYHSKPTHEPAHKPIRASADNPSAKVKKEGAKQKSGQTSSLAATEKRPLSGLKELKAMQAWAIDNNLDFELMKNRPSQSEEIDDSAATKKTQKPKKHTFFKQKGQLKYSSESGVKDVLYFGTAKPPQAELDAEQAKVKEEDKNILVVKDIMQQLEKHINEMLQHKTSNTLTLAGYNKDMQSAHTEEKRISAKDKYINFIKVKTSKVNQETAIYRFVRVKLNEKFIINNKPRLSNIHRSTKMENGAISTDIIKQIVTDTSSNSLEAANKELADARLNSEYAQIYRAEQRRKFYKFIKELAKTSPKAANEMKNHVEKIIYAFDKQ